MSGPTTETAQFVPKTAAPTISPLPPPPYGWQPVPAYLPMVYTVLPPPGYIGTLQLGPVTFTCNGSGWVAGVNVTPTVNADGSLTIAVTEDSTLFPASSCYQNSWNQSSHQYVQFTVNLIVSGVNPSLSPQYFPMPLQVLAPSPAISLSTSLYSSTGNTQTYLATVNSANFAGPVTLGLQAGSCAMVMGSAPTVQLPNNGTANATIPLLTAGCAPGASQAITFTAQGSGVIAVPVTLLLQTSSTAAVLTSPPKWATIAGGATTFSWGAVSGAQQYSLLVGSSQGAGDIYNNGNLGTAVSVSVTLPTSGVVYATLGTQAGGVWQTTSSWYTVSASPSTQALSVIGPSDVAVANNGRKVRKTYYFSSGDPTTIVSISVGTTGVTATLVGTSASTATVEFAGSSSMPVGSPWPVTAHTYTAALDIGYGDPFFGPTLYVDPSGGPPGTWFTFSSDASDGNVEITGPGGPGGAPLVRGAASVQLTAVGNYQAVLHVDDEGVPLPVEDGVVLDSAPVQFTVEAYKVTLTPASVVMGAGSSQQFTFVAAVDPPQPAQGTYTYTWQMVKGQGQNTDDPSVAALVNCGQQQQPQQCSVSPNANGGKASLQVTVSDGYGNSVQQTARLIVVQIKSVQVQVPSSVGANMVASFNTAIPASGPLQWPSSLWAGATPLVLVRDSVTGLGVQASTVPPPTDSEMPPNIIAYDVRRAPDDVAAICPGGCTAASVPSVAPGVKGSGSVGVSETGSFQVIAFVDTNGTGQWAAGETGVALPLILVQATVTENDSSSPVSSMYYVRSRDSNGNWVGSKVASGNILPCDLTVENVVNCPADLKAKVNLVGGGDGTRGTTLVYAGWTQNLSPLMYTETASYQNNHSDKIVYASNIPAGRTDGGNPPKPVAIFLPGDPAPNSYQLPLLDQSQKFPNGDPLPEPGQGGNTSLSGSLMTYDTTPALGRTVIVECVDYPAAAFIAYHPAGVQPNGFVFEDENQLTNIAFTLYFNDYLVLWTSATGAPDPIYGTPPPNGSLAERTYAVALQQLWTLSASYNIDATGNGTGSGTVAVNTAAATAYQPLLPAANLGVVLVPPRALDVMAENARQ